MGVLMTARIPGATQELMDGVTAQLGDALRNSPGFVFHVNGPIEDGWQVVEVWDSRADFEEWFENNVKPAFPDGVPLPSLSFHETHAVIER